MLIMSTIACPYPHKTHKLPIYYGNSSLYNYSYFKMIEKVKAPVSVITVYDHKTRKFMPIRILWDGKTYKVTKLGMKHTYREGRELIHIFSVETATLFFRLAFNSEKLLWTLEEIADGEAN